MSSKSSASRVMFCDCRAMMAEVLLLQHDVAAAEEWLTRANDDGNANDDRYFSAEIHRLSATCLAFHGRTEAARAALRSALRMLLTWSRGPKWTLRVGF